MNCHPCAPGAENAQQFLQGDSQALWKELFFLSERCLLVGAGLFLVGIRDKKLWQGALAGGLAVELFVLGYVATNRKS